jgi:serine/threonine protein kinase
MGFLERLFGRRGNAVMHVDLWRRFERLRASSAGTMSAFYKVRDNTTGEVRGLKVIDRAKSEPVEQRYRGLGKPSEGEIGAAITAHHAGTSAAIHLGRTLEWGSSTDGEPFVLQEFIEGTLLHTLLSSRKPLPPAQRLDLVRQTATAVGAVHAAGFVHRDICPRNFILRPDGTLVLFDFGLAVPNKPAFLQPGNRIGTPNYMAPEVVRRRQGDQRLDIFSFGVTAYEICTLELPWPRGSSGKAALSHDSPPDDIRTHWPDVPPPLADAIMSCVAAEPGDRPATLEEFLRRIVRVTIG